MASVRIWRASKKTDSNDCAKTLCTPWGILGHSPWVELQAHSYLLGRKVGGAVVLVVSTKRFSSNTAEKMIRLYMVGKEMLHWSWCARWAGALGCMGRTHSWVPDGKGGPRSLHTLGEVDSISSWTDFEAGANFDWAESAELENLCC